VRHWWMARGSFAISSVSLRSALGGRIWERPEGSTRLCLGALRSDFSYFKDAIEEAAASKVGDDNWQHLRQSIDGLEKEWLQKAGLSR